MFDPTDAPLIPSETYRWTWVCHCASRKINTHNWPIWNVCESVGSISTAEGSALVRMGATTVVCGVKAEIAEPELDRESEGFLGAYFFLQYPSGKVRSNVLILKPQCPTSIFQQCVRPSSSRGHRQKRLRCFQIAWTRSSSRVFQANICIPQKLKNKMAVDPTSYPFPPFVYTPENPHGCSTSTQHV